MKLSPENLQWMTDTQREWHRRLQPNSTHLGQHLFDVPERLTQAAVKDARLFADRVEALQFFQQGQTVAELGTQAGWYAQRIVETLAPRELHLFDLDFGLLEAEREELSRLETVTLHKGDSAEMLGGLPDQYFDWIYVDGDHNIDGVKRDASVAVRKVKQDGILVFNDYTPWSIMELNDYGVMPVVNNLIHGGEWKVVYFTFHQHMYCDIAIRRIYTGTN
jgi:protein-L-isoaspartate O-methyltransferase